MRYFGALLLGWIIADVTINNKYPPSSSDHCLPTSLIFNNGPRAFQPVLKIGLLKCWTGPETRNFEIWLTRITKPCIQCPVPKPLTGPHRNLGFQERFPELSVKRQ